MRHGQPILDTNIGQTYPASFCMCKSMQACSSLSSGDPSGLCRLCKVPACVLLLRLPCQLILCLFWLLRRCGCLNLVLQFLQLHILRLCCSCCHLFSLQAYSPAFSQKKYTINTRVMGPFTTPYACSMYQSCGVKNWRLSCCHLDLIDICSSSTCTSPGSAVSAAATSSLA